MLPALEIVATTALTNLTARQFVKPADFDVTWTSIRRNLRSRWVIDEDYFEVNQLLHPYQGAAYHATARSTGLNYWQSTAYTFAGSALWEIAGETTPPSRNDQIASGIAGSFLGEPLFRTARLLIEGSGGGRWWRTLAAAILSPPTAVNHALFGERFAARHPAPPSAVDTRVEIGATSALTGTRQSAMRRHHESGTLGFFVEQRSTLPGDTAVRRPFDHYQLEGVVSPRAVQSLFVRGVIAGNEYASGQVVSGIWGLYGLYDYFAPDVMKVSSTALALGSTMRVRLWEAIRLQPAALLGVGYTAMEPAEQISQSDRYGAAPQALVNLRLVAGCRASLDLTSRGYWISDDDRVVRGEASLTVRIIGPHGLGIKYSSSRRATTPSSRSTIGFFYTLLGAGRVQSTGARSSGMNELDCDRRPVTR